MGAADSTPLGESDEQDRIGHCHADRHDGAHERLDVQGRPGDPESESNAGNDGRHGEQDRERQTERLKIRRQQQKDGNDRDAEPEPRVR